MSANPAPTTGNESKSASTSPDKSSSGSAFTPSSSSSKGPDAGKVVMVTASSGTKGFLGIPQLKSMVYENRMTYAVRHGYAHMWANITSYNLPN
ncbi:MAG: hypothetical protein Q9184_008040, partial [Pyrenodesmia sp. 2 TL-2023]